MTRPLMVIAALVAALAAAGVGAGAEWDVYPGAGTPIQDAIDGAGDNDTIYVHAGTYVENVDVDKRLTLIGDGADVVTVRAADARDHAFEVRADWVNISRFMVTRATGGDVAGIHLGNTDCCSICNINASNNRCGIYLSYSSNNTLASNIASNNDYGIRMWSSSNHNTLTNNTVNSNGHGIALLSSSSNTLTSNTVNSNDWNGIALSSSSSNTLTSNTASGNYCGIGLEFSSNNNTLHHNNLINNTEGNAYDGGIHNQWDSGSAGNYWNNYAGNDTDHDGIGDEPHYIEGSAGSVDRYPLMHFYSTSQSGDLDGDSELTPYDATIALAIAAGGAHNPAADVSGDGRVTSLDALLILKAAAGAIEL